MRKFILAVVASLAAGPASACTVRLPFEIGQIGAADLVLVGEVTGYQDLGTPWGSALVTVEVEATLKGQASGEMLFLWNGGMAQRPQAARASGRVLIGAMEGGRMAQSDRVPDPRPDLPSIIQPYCGEVWMQPATKARLDAARKALG